MRIIVKGKDPIPNLWVGSLADESGYRLLRYHVRAECEEGELLLNTVTGELVLLSEEESRLLKDIPIHRTPEIDELITHRFLVPELFDDTRSVDQLRALLKKLEESEDVTGYSILPTTGCNARCFYCYESNIPHHTMTMEVADRIAEYMDSHRGKNDKLSIKWFGGEPTLGESQIDHICERLEDKGIGFTSSMISNAYLFTKEMAAKAKKKWKLNFIQITLDGTEDVYNKIKAYTKIDDNPYTRVLRNIGYLLDEDIRVSVRMNLGFHNVDDLEGLIKELGERFAGKNGFSAYVAPLFENQGFEPVSNSDEERHELARAVCRLDQMIEDCGCRKSTRFSRQSSLPSLKAFYCMADNPRSLQVNPLGQFNKCEHELYGRIIGTVETGHDNHQETAKYWLMPTYQEGCKGCKLYPVCGLIKSCEARVCVEELINERVGEVRKQMIYRYHNNSGQ